MHPECAKDVLKVIDLLHNKYDILNVDEPQASHSILFDLVVDLKNTVAKESTVNKISANV